MGLVIRNLLALQEVDLKIVSRRNEKSTLLGAVTNKKSALEEGRRQLEEREAELKRVKVEAQRSEVELAEVTERIRKLESQQIHVKTNQEYKALDKEIYEAKARKARTEDLLLQKMELIEQESVGIRESRQGLDVQCAEAEQEIGVVEGRTLEIDGRVAQLQEERARIAAGIEDRVVRLYDRICDSKGGPALVPLVNRACQGCHLAVPAAVESVLRRRKADIITCENCSRILYIPPEEDNGSSEASS